MYYNLWNWQYCTIINIMNVDLVYLLFYSSNGVAKRKGVFALQRKQYELQIKALKVGERLV